jgi:VWFA-related protein
LSELVFRKGRKLLVNRRYPLALIATMASAIAFQNTNHSGGAATFGSTTKLVHVNVVAVDKDGSPVVDLRQEDFELFEDGRPQGIAVFVPERATPAAPPAPTLNEFTNQFTAANSSRSGYALILLDWLNSSVYARITSQQQVLRLLRQIAMRDLVSLCVLDHGFRVLHDFTSDRAELVKRISASYVALGDTPPDNAAALSEADSLDMSPDELALSRMNRFLGSRRILNTFKAFEQIAQYLSAAPGRKSLIWVTSGFPSAIGYDRKITDDPADVDAWSRAMTTERRSFSAEMDRAVRLLNNADIAVYPVDVRGLLVGPGGRINVAAMTEVASRTGGRAFYDRNDIDVAMRSALDDSQISYTLGYYSANGGDDRKYHSIRVKVRRPDVALRYRSGYEGDGNRGSSTAKIDLQQVLESPLDATVLPVSAHAEKIGGRLDVRLKIDPSTLGLREENGRRKGRVSIFFTFRPEDASGRLPVSSVSSAFDLTKEQFQALAERGMTFRKQLSLPAKATSLRLVVRDEETALMGSVTIPLSAVR